jgi:GABA permease
VSGVSRLTDEGGFFPSGAGARPAALLTTMFSFMGTEIVTIAAAESEDPEKQIGKATRSVIWRISLFYLASIFLITCLVPWSDPRLVDPGHGSFSTALEAIGIPGAKSIMDVVVLVAVASCLNSALYTASRMAFALARRGDGPERIGRVSRGGVPRGAVLASVVVGFLAVIANYVVPEKVFSTLLATSGAVALLVYLAIAVSQLRLRRTLTAEGVDLPIRMWGFPVVTWGVIVFIPVILVYMAIGSDLQLELFSTAITAAVVVALGLLVQARQRARAGADGAAAD